MIIIMKFVLACLLLVWGPDDWHSAVLNAIIIHQYVCVHLSQGPDLLQAAMIG